MREGWSGRARAAEAPWYDNGCGKPGNWLVALERMLASDQSEMVVRLLQATPEQWAAVHRILGVAVPAPGARGLMVLPPGAAAVRPAADPAYLLRRQHGVWRLVFEGEEAILRDEKGVHYVAHLLKSQPGEPIHCSELAAGAVGDAVIEGQRNLAADDGESLAALSKARREQQSVIDDDDASVDEKEEAHRELEKINDWARRHVRGTEASEQRQARAIRQAIRRLLWSLAAAEDGTLRAFGEHLEMYLWKPSSRSAEKRSARVKSGYAARFTYEPPKGVAWSG